MFCLCTLGGCLWEFHFAAKAFLLLLFDFYCVLCVLFLSFSFLFWLVLLSYLLFDWCLRSFYEVGGYGLAVILRNPALDRLPASRVALGGKGLFYL